MSKEELLEFLDKYQIPYKTWGHGRAKTFDDLLRELNEDDSTLIIENGKVLRKSYGVIINIFYIDGTVTKKLKEDRQVFLDGRIKTRNITTSLGEKMKPGERCIDTANRAIREELGIKEELPMEFHGPRFLGPTISDSFPGTYSFFTMFLFELLLPHRHFNAEGYVEVQETKTTYFKWEKI